jgi:hypothetical protein
MRRTSVLLVAGALAAALTCIPRDAHALGPIDIELGARVGGATNPFGGNPQPPNPLGFGLGARGGVTLFGFYGGLSVMYYFGGSQSATLGTTSVSSSYNSLLYGGELGYNIKVALLTIRPLLGIGNYSLNTSNSPGGSSSNNNLYLEPGLTGLISLGTWFLGADANALILPSMKQPDQSTSTNVAFTLHGQVGVRF